jgi:hypothetical protein
MLQQLPVELHCRKCLRESYVIKGPTYTSGFRVLDPVEANYFFNLYHTKAELAVAPTCPKCAQPNANGEYDLFKPIKSLSYFLVARRGRKLCCSAMPAA